MILFQNDWARYPNAIVDYETKNESFKRIVSVYREMGIKNCLFPLTLLQPELQGIDPFDKTLDEATKVKIGLECTYNYWYFIREVVRIPPVASPNPVPYIANRGNIAMSWLFLNNIDSALIQPRQTGKSVSTDCIMDWVVYVAATNTLVSMITKDHDLRTKNVERLKKIRDYLPPYISKKTKQDTDNQLSLTCSALNNYYLTGVAQNSESAANNLGRGLTSPVMHIDEGPFIRFVGVTLPAALAAGTSAREEAEKNGKPYGNIFTTTAGKRDDRDGKYMYDLIHGGAVWNEIFYDCEDKTNLEGLIVKQSTGRKTIVNVTMSHRQLGKTDDWLYRAISNANATGEEADRDFFNVWTSGTLKSPLSTQLNGVVKDSEIDPVWVEITKDNYVINWYITEAEFQERSREGHFVIGLDTSEGIGRDAIAMIIVDISDLSVVGAADVNETNLIRYAKFLSEVLIRYPSTTLVPERKSSAQSIIDALLIHLSNVGIDPFRRIYNVIVDAHTERAAEYNELFTPLGRRTNAFYDRFKKSCGFVTTGQSRDLLYSTVLINAAKNSGHLIHDRKLSSEIRGLVTKNGRIDHNSSGHDDMVISWLLCHWFLTQSKNLEFYGIREGLALSRVYGVNKKLSLEEEIDVQEQRHYRAEIDLLYEKLAKVNDEYLVAQYEAKLRALSLKVKSFESDGLSIDSLIRKANDDRLRNIKRKQLANRSYDRSNLRNSIRR